ncbi:MAG: hypothetical protein KAI27_00845 [Rhodospirillaceae bacterium]|nr:hypothetical protein [Rhodospirillaceae bacterium]
MTKKQTFHRAKCYVLSPRDELAFSRVLREVFPDVMFAQDDYRSHPSNMPLIPSIAHSKKERIQIIIPSPGQEKRMKINHDFNTIMVQPECRFNYDRSHWEYPHDTTRKYAFDFPLLGWGEIVSSYPRDNDIYKKFSGKVMRLINKVCSGSIGYDAMRISSEGGKRCCVGVGVHIDEPKPFERIKYYQDDLWDDSPNGITPLPECRGFRH